jgi:hypothetical protein
MAKELPHTAPTHETKAYTATVSEQESQAGSPIGDNPTEPIRMKRTPQINHREFMYVKKK